jgi:hypothetical protein
MKPFSPICWAIKLFWIASACLLVSVPASSQSNRVIITANPGYTILWDGNNGGFYDPDIGALAPDNDAHWQNGTTTFASSSFDPGGVHDAININDGWYGNHSSWISDFTIPDPDPFAGLNFNRQIQIRSIAWSRDNGDETEPSCGGTCRDRVVGVYTLQVTTVASPDEGTPETGNASSGWATIGTVEYLPGADTQFFSAYLRHRFDVSQNGNPIAATGFRIKVSDPNIAMDEIEVNPPADPNPPILSLIEIASEPEYNIVWDGSEGLFSDPLNPATVPENIALASSGSVAFASSQSGSFLTSQLNDGLFGNSNSWRPDSQDADPFAGIRLPESIPLRNIGWSRDNTGVQTDQALGTYTVQFTEVQSPDENTTETGDPNSGWATLGTVEYKGTAAIFNPHLLHSFQVSRAGGPLHATGLRIKVSDPGMVLDQIVINVNQAIAEGAIRLQLESGYSILWDGNDGEFFNPNAGARAPDHDGLASKGVTVFASSELEGFGGIHLMNNVNDGLYGNNHSWISGPTLGADPDPFIGLNFGRTIDIRSIAWSRDNGNSVTDCCGGQLTDRWEGIYTLQVTTVSSPDADTWETGDPSTGWVTIAAVEYSGVTDDFRPWLRHRFEVAQNGEPISATGLRIMVSNNAICIDEIEVNPQEVPPPPVQLESAAGYVIHWNGNDGDFSSPNPGAAPPGNLALGSRGTVAFGSSELDLGVHYIRNVNDGLYGNASSWIARFTDPPDPDPFIGLNFGRLIELRNVAWSRDNGDDTERDPPGPFTDRSLGLYTLQVTAVGNPGADTPETGDPSTGWVTVGTIDYSTETSFFRPWLRHRFDVSLEDGSPIPATGLRLKVPGNQIAIDEIEVNPQEHLRLNPEPGFVILWDGNEGEFFSPDDPAPAPDNLASAATGAMAFGSSELDFGVHFIHHVNDGLYGNSRSWIADFTLPDPDPFIGIQFNRIVSIGSIAWGRDNGNNVSDACGGQCADRWQGIYTLQYTRVADPGLVADETSDSATGWVTVGTVEYTGSDSTFEPWLRHRFEVSREGAPIEATGLRIKVSNVNIAIDEIEVYDAPASAPVIQISFTAGQVTLSWTGEGTLQAAETLPGTWMDLPNATSPHTISAFESQQYFRLQR